MNHEFQKLKLTVTLNIDVLNLPEGITLDGISEFLNHDHWDEGRYPFHDEMAHEGLRQRVTRSIGEAVQLMMAAKFGYERIEEGASSTLRSYVETRELMKTVYVGVSDSFKDAKLEE